MRVLVVIPHYYRPTGGLDGDGRHHGSVGADPGSRAAALGECLAAWRRLFGVKQCVIDLPTRGTGPANAATAAERLDVVVCTTGGCHVLDRLGGFPAGVEHRETGARPTLLGFACHEVLRERLGGYDFYVYMEDDLVIRDPWLFAKLGWFNGHLGDELLLQPNRYEAGAGEVDKAYIDATLAERVAGRFQDVRVGPTLRSRFLNGWVRFARTTNPHAGCFFLNERQMRAWAGRPDFLDGDTSFVGPLESAATLGVTRSFRVYKAAAENAAFFEVEHWGTSFLRLIRGGKASGGGGA